MLDDRGSRAAALSGLALELALFWSSYAALFALLALRFEPTWLRVVCGLLAGGGLAVAVAVAHVYPRQPGRSWVATAAEDRGSEVAGYVATYLSPFVMPSDPRWQDVAAYALFLALVAVVQLRSDLVQINPTLYVLGYRLFAISVGEGWRGFLLSRRSVRPGSSVDVTRIAGRLFVERRAA